MTLPTFTLFLVLAGLAHLVLQLTNRQLLQMDDKLPKRLLQGLAFGGLLVLPMGLLLVFDESAVVAEALDWRPRSTGARLLFAAFGGLWLVMLWRLGLWAADRILPARSKHWVSDRLRVPAVPRPPHRFPPLLRPLETTWALEVVERELIVPNLAAEFDGLTIAHVADIHYDARRDQAAWLDAIVGIVNSSACDIVAFTGDFVNDERFIAPSVEFHARMKGRLATLCVLGNHDYWTDPRAVRAQCARHGIRPMHNKRWSIERAGRRMTFVGSDAPWGRARTSWRSLIERSPTDAVVVLSHTPDNAPVAARAGANLILSGHMHGGQYCLPFVGAVLAPSRLGHRFIHGVYDVGPDCVLTVSRGLGGSDSGSGKGGGRLLCPPELVFLTLRSPAVDVAVPVTEEDKALAPSP